MELIKNGFAEPLASAVGLWAIRLRAGVINVFDSEVEFVFVVLGVAAKLGAPVGWRPNRRNVAFLAEGNGTIIEHL